MKKGDTLEQKEVRLGTLLTSVVEVVNGLQEGEEVVIGMQTGKPAMGPPQTGETESSPFMPKPPGSDKKNKK